MLCHIFGYRKIHTMRYSFAVLCILAVITLPAQTRKQSVNSGRKDMVKMEKGKKVWMLTYFRQRYPTRIEIDSTGKTVEVPLADPMLIAKLHIALSTDGRHWTPLND